MLAATSHVWEDDDFIDHAAHTGFEPVHSSAVVLTTPGGQKYPRSQGMGAVDPAGHAKPMEQGAVHADEDSPVSEPYTPIGHG